MESNINYDNYKIRVKEISYSGTSAKVKPSWLDDEEVIIKCWPYEQKYLYLKEKNIYLKLKNEKYVPNIIQYDDKTLCIIIEDAGDSLRKMIRSNQKHLLPKNLIFRLDYIMKQLYLKYGLIHGDITFRNMCFKNDQLYLIDFDKTQNLDVLSFDYNNPNERLCKNVHLLTNYNYYFHYMISELNNKSP